MVRITSFRPFGSKHGRPVRPAQYNEGRIAITPAVAQCAASAAGKVIRRMLGTLSCPLPSGFHPLASRSPFEGTPIFSGPNQRPSSNDRRYNLIIRVLNAVALLPGGYPGYGRLIRLYSYLQPAFGTIRWEEKSVHVLVRSGFPGAVRPGTLRQLAPSSQYQYPRI